MLYKVTRCIPQDVQLFTKHSVWIFIFHSHAGPAVGNDRSVIAQAAYIKATPCDRGCCGGLCCVGIQIPEIIARATFLACFAFL